MFQQTITSITSIGSSESEKSACVIGFVRVYKILITFFKILDPVWIHSLVWLSGIFYAFVYANFDPRKKSNKEIADKNGSNFKHKMKLVMAEKLKVVTFCCCCCCCIWCSSFYLIIESNAWICH